MDLGLTDLEVHRVTSTVNADLYNFDETEITEDHGFEAKARLREEKRQNELQALYLKETEQKR